MAGPCPAPLEAENTAGKQAPMRSSMRDLMQTFATSDATVREGKRGTEVQGSALSPGRRWGWAKKGWCRRQQIFQQHVREEDG